MNATEQIAADLDRLASPRIMSPSQRQEMASRIVRMRAAEAKTAKAEAEAKQATLRRGVLAQLDEARSFFRGDVPVEVEEALREIARLVG